MPKLYLQTTVQTFGVGKIFLKCPYYDIFKVANIVLWVS